jgi:hypothetical protein
MEGRDPHLPAIDTEQVLDPRAHFPGRFVRERDGENAIRLGEPVADEMGNTVRDDTRLARSGASQDQDRTIGLQYC